MIELHQGVRDANPSSHPAGAPSHSPAYSVHSADDVGGLLESIACGPHKHANPKGSIRAAVANPTAERLEVAARIVARGLPHNGPRGIWFMPSPPGRGKCAFLFPGAESRRPRLGELAEQLGFTPPGDILDTRDPLSEGRRAAEAGALLEHALQLLGVLPDARVGLSSGEWAALIAAGGVPDSSRLLDRRHVGLKCPDCVYLAVPKSAGTLHAVLVDENLQHQVFISHRNSPLQSIACGALSDVKVLQDALAMRGIAAVRLDVRSGFHCPAYAPFVDQALAFLDLRGCTPRQEVWSCVNARPFPEDPRECTQLIRRSFTEPVDFEGTIRAMYATGYRTFVDLGCGSLAQLTGEILADAPHVSTATAHHSRDALSSLQRAVLALWASHRDVEPDALDKLPSSPSCPDYQASRICHEFKY